jgi:hypothetical protein
VLPEPTRSPPTNMVTADSARSRECGSGDGGEEQRWHDTHIPPCFSSFTPPNFSMGSIMGQCAPHMLSCFLSRNPFFSVESIMGRCAPHMLSCFSSESFFFCRINDRMVCTSHTVLFSLWKHIFSVELMTGRCAPHMPSRFLSRNPFFLGN